MPAPNTVAEPTRNGRRPNWSAAHPRRAMAKIEAAAPMKRANPRGPGERSSVLLKSASTTAKVPQKRPKKPKAKSSKTRRQYPDARRASSPLTGARLCPRTLPFAAPVCEAIHGDRYELAHQDGQGRYLYRRPCRVEYEVQKAGPDKKLQPSVVQVHSSLAARGVALGLRQVLLALKLFLEEVVEHRADDHDRR